MTKTATPSTPTKPVLVVFGLDQTGKPKAARFTGTQSEAAREAAAAMQLTVFEATGPELEELSKKLPVGRLHARGKAFIPYIKRDLYDRLRAASGKSASNGKNVAAREEPSLKKTQASEVLPVAFGLPQNWTALLQVTCPDSRKSERRLVGSNCNEPGRRDPHATVSRLPQGAELPMSYSCSGADPSRPCVATQ
jgi:hypothetical protein